MQNMFRIKPINFTITIPKLPKLENVPINVVVVVTTCI